jgi:hypothetical protein
MEIGGVANITPEKAVEILKKNGMQVTIEQAKQILEFLYKLAKITLSIYAENSP